MNNKHLTYFVLFFLLFVCGLIIIFQPYRFQKWNSIKSSSQYEGDREFKKKKYIDIQNFVANIPYKKNSTFAYTVYPKERYEKTIINGSGDCSNFSFGGAYFLLKNNINFEILHFSISDTLFYDGGHVVLRVPYILNDIKGIGILDLAGGGVPKFNNKIADYFDLIGKNKIGEIHFERINNAAPKYFENYYKEKYLNKVHIGFTQSSDVLRYFNFLETVYIPLGNRKIEKMFYDGLSILFGQYYTIYVDEEFLSQFLFQMYFFKAILFLVRILLLTLTLIMIFELTQKFIKKASGIYAIT